MDSLKKAVGQAYRDGVKDGRVDELTKVIRAIGRLAREVFNNPGALEQLDRVQEMLKRRMAIINAQDLSYN